MRKAFSKSTVFGLLLVILLVINAGGSVSAGMMMEDGSMPNCPYMGVSALCKMSPLEHMFEWHSMFTATLQKFATAALALLALAVFGYLVGKLHVPRRAEVYTPRYRYRERVFDPLRLLFARGIIHSKAF